MARDHRMLDDDGNRIDFTCENRRFRTDRSRFAPGARPGSVLPEPLYDDGSYSLWLEHVVEIANENHVFWLMWYRDGVPTIPLSGVLNKENLKEVIGKLTTVNDQLLAGTNT